MCGIAGWIDYNRDIRKEESVLQAMSLALKKRGCTDDGMYVGINAGLLHRRFVVVDNNKEQPIFYEINDEIYVLAYNGELFNTNEVRNELIERGYEFSGHSDSEVILKSFVEWGEVCVEKLNGVFAFAIWQESKKKLFLVRDRIGVKPLFYYPYNGGIIFASELKALLKHPDIKHVIDKEGLSELLLLGPGRTQGCGVVKGVEEVLPGEFITFSQCGMEKHKYWDLTAHEHEDNLEQTIEKTRELLKDSVERQLISDAPICCMLSGGLDSSIMSKFASDHYKKQNKKLSTYSVDYTDNEKYFVKSNFQPNMDNEFIKIMVDDINSEHKNVVIQNEDLAEALYEATDARNLPGMVDIDSSLLLFSKAIKKDFSVAISGECSDEIFGGYPWYHNKEILFKDCFPWAPSMELRKFVIKDDIFQGYEEYANERYKATVNSTSKLDTDNELDSRMREMFRLNFYWFMQTLLDRGDRMTTYYGLEVRMPFCDYRVVEYAYNMPWEYKALNGREKGMLRESMKGLLPEKIIERKKSPYPKTHNPLYLRIVSKKLLEIFERKNSILNELINKEAVKEIINNPDLVKAPWYGQLMRAPQMLAYLIQLDYWFDKYDIDIV